MMRVGIVHYLNAWPLAWSFLDGEMPEGYEPVFLPPSGVADELAAGRLDVGLLPTAELARIPDLAVVPGLCIASATEVKSVLLVSRVAPSAVARLALDESSRSSAVLVQILLAERWGVQPETVTAAPDLETMLADSDAALLIGDPALAVDRERYHVIDLALAWREHTGLPFVFAVWAAPFDRELSSVVRTLHESLERGQREHDRVVDQASRRLGMERGELDRYLRHNLRYRLGPLEERSLGEFFARGHRLGLLPRVPELRFVAEDEAISSPVP